MSGLAVALFIALFLFGGNYFGWDDPHGRIAMALFASFIFGVVAGTRIKA